MIEGFFAESIVRRGQEKGAVDIALINLRDFAVDRYGSVDDRPYGGGVGMVLRVEPIYRAVQEIKMQNAKCKISMKNSKVILTSPKGKLFTQYKAVEYSKFDHLMIIVGHYEGVDERVRSFVDEEVSLGDFVMTGGEIAACAIADSVVRLLPGVLKKDEATMIESFFEVSIETLARVVDDQEIVRKLQKKGAKKIKLLEYPHYTRPEEFHGQKVPEILLSGNHAEIEKWRLKCAFEETMKRRPDLLV